MTAEEILVIILSITLAVLLILVIILVSHLIIFAKKLNHLADMAERTVDHVEGFVSNMQSATAPVAVGNFLMDMVSRLIDRRKKR